MKKMIAGILIGCTISFGIAYAEDIIKVQRATFTVWINGNQFESNKPILTVDNTAYVPVKDFSSYINAKTTWDSTNKRVEISNVPYFSEWSVVTNSFRITDVHRTRTTKIEENKFSSVISLKFENFGSTPINIDFLKDFKLRDTQDELVSCISNEKLTIEPGQTNIIHLKFEVKGDDLKGYLDFIYKPSIREYSIPVTFAAEPM